MAITGDFADYCCELLSSLGQGDTLWLKVDEVGKPRFEAEGCARFTYDVKGQLKGMNYYAAPADAMESPALMAPWARAGPTGCAGRARGQKA